MEPEKPTQLKARCSSLPLLAACPAAAQSDGWIVDRPSEAADLGTAVHDLLAARISGRLWNIEAAARRHQVDHSELERLFWWGWRSWSELLAPHFPDPQTEMAVSWLSPNGVLLTGHIDVASLLATEVRVCDHKSGRAYVDPWHQVRGYCWLLMQHKLEAEHAYGAYIRVRDEESFAERFSREELAAWWERVEDGLLNRQHVYNPGARCSHCVRRLACPAKPAFVERSIAEVAAFGDVAPMMLGAVYDAIKVAENACDAAREALKVMAKEAGGELDLGDGRALKIIAQRQQQIDPRIGLPVLRDHLDEDAIAIATTIGKSKLETAIRATAGSGQKYLAVKDVFDHLISEGAITYKATERLECRRSAKAIGAEA